MTVEELGNLSVHEVRERRLASAIAQRTGLAYSLVSGRIRRAHGRTLIRNLFVEAAPTLITRNASPAPPSPTAPLGNGPPRSTGHTIHRVRQEFTTSCGVAVVAMFARVSHREAMAVMFPERKSAYYTWLRDVKRALDHFGVSYASRWHRFRSWETIPTTSLVKVRWRDADGSTGLHWVIFQRRKDGTWRVIDPDPMRPGTLRLNGRELRRYEGITYLQVDAREPA